MTPGLSGSPERPTGVLKAVFLLERKPLDFWKPARLMGVPKAGFFIGRKAPRFFESPERLTTLPQAFFFLQKNASIILEAMEARDIAVSIK